MLFLDENTNCSPEGFLQHQMPLFDAQFYSCLYGRASYLVVGLLLWQHCQRAASPWDVLSTENSKPQFTGRAAAVIALIVHLLMRCVWTWCEIQGESQGSRGNVLWIYTPPPQLCEIVLSPPQTEKHTKASPISSVRMLFNVSIYLF